MMVRSRGTGEGRQRKSPPRTGNGRAAGEPLFPLRDLPKYEALEALALRFPELDPSAAEAYLVLLRVSADILAAAATHLGRHGLSMGRFSVLMLLLRAQGTGVSPSVLAEKSGVTRATMTGLVDRLEREGLVRRESNQSDRRSHTVRLTPKGDELLSGMLPAHFRRVARLMAQVGAGERKSLVALLEKVKKGLPFIRDP